MLDSVTTIVLHCTATLPESATARKDLLVALGNVVSIKHPAFDLIRGHLSMIEIEQRLQKELPLQPPTQDGQ